jgi:hypothetical protein
MNREPTVVIRFDGDEHVYRPGETLSGRYWIESIDAEHVKAIETSVLWHTEGKGDEDMAVVEFWRREPEDERPPDPRRPVEFSATLPRSPLSYDGQIIKVRWQVRVRVFLHRGKEVLGEKVFQLGGAPAAGVESRLAGHRQAVGDRGRT